MRAAWIAGQRHAHVRRADGDRGAGVDVPHRGRRRARGGAGLDASDGVEGKRFRRGVGASKVTPAVAVAAPASLAATTWTFMAPPARSRSQPISAAPPGWLQDWACGPEPVASNSEHDGDDASLWVNLRRGDRGSPDRIEGPRDQERMVFGAGQRARKRDGKARGRVASPRHGHRGLHLDRRAQPRLLAASADPRLDGLRLRRVPTLGRRKAPAHSAITFSPLPSIV